MKKLNKKGFTIVELVIVIAVIAILAAVLIPTFSGVVSKANQSGALQTATSTMKSTLAMSDYGTLAEGTIFVVDSMGSDGYQFEYKNNKIETASYSSVNYSTPTATQTSLATSKNAIIINKAEAENFAKSKVQNIIKNAVGTGTLTSVSGQKWAYTYKVGDNVWNVYTNTDYAKNVVTFTYSK